MEHEGILIEVDQGRVVRVLCHGVALPAGAAVTYDGADPLLMQVREPTQAEQIECIVAALREGRANAQRHGIRTACQSASRHYQAIAQTAGALAHLLANITRAKEEEPAALLTRIQEAANRIDDEVLGEVRQQLLVACAEAMELRVAAEQDERQPPPPPRSVDREPDEIDSNEFAEQLRRAYQR